MDETYRKVVLIKDKSVRYVYVLGDVHGDFATFEKMVKAFIEQKEPGNLLITLGDYADRGEFGVEVIEMLNSLVQTRDDIIALKGNHEDWEFPDNPSFSPCDLMREAHKKRGSWYKFYKETYLGFLGRLKVAAIVNNVLFVHGGVSLVIDSVEALAYKSNESELLWSDPTAPYQVLDYEEMTNYRRREGVVFGPKVTEKVLKATNTKIIVRSHEPRLAKNGPHITHEGRVITVNASAVYGNPFILKINTQTTKYRAVYETKQGYQLKTNRRKSRGN